MDVLVQLWGEGKELNALQMSCRSVVMFIIAMILIRLAGVKTFGKATAFDNIVIIMLGALLTRGVVGVSPFVPVVFAGLTMVLLSRAISWLCIRSKAFSHFVKGRPLSLYKNGNTNRANLTEGLLSEGDLMEGVRKETNTATLDDVQEVFLERNGEISVIKK
jgi:uncharacterized membrane protein YcaP (DUF421 family)